MQDGNGGLLIFYGALWEFDFHLLLAKQLFSDFNDYKKHSSAPVSRRNDFDLP